MKKPKCPFCNRSLGKTFGVLVKGDTYYYFEKEKFGYINFPYSMNVFQTLKNRRFGYLHLKGPLVTGLYCRSCSKNWPQDHVKKVLKYIKLWKTLNRFGK